MSRLLRDYAIENIWCNPRQDSQFTFRPKRISGELGARNTAQILNRNIRLPEKTKRYHVFQIGQINVNQLNVFRDLPDWKIDQWFSLYDTINGNNTLVTVYDHQGVVVPGFTCFLMYMDERNLVIAIEENKLVPVDYRRGTFYIRVYQNTYFESTRFNSEVAMMATGRRVLNQNEILALQNTFNDYNSREGLTYAYVNGIRRHKVALTTAQVGDYVEIIFDASVYKVINFPIKILPTFVSRLDGLRKWLLHYVFDNVNMIEYFDDCELHIHKDIDSERFHGVYFYRHQPRTMRMVTHRDYSVCVDDGVYIADKLRNLIDEGVAQLEDYTLQLIVRHSGYARPLVYEGHRLHELYKLGSLVVKNTLLGNIENIYLWRVEELETSQYNLLMSEDITRINEEKVINALGYNAISKLVADTPHKLPLNITNRSVILPHHLHSDSTVYEYDSDGILIGSYYNIEGAEYIARHPETVYFETIKGKGSHYCDGIYFRKEETATVPSLCNWRLYRCHENNGIVDNLWEDITEGDEYTLTNNVIQYTGEDPNTVLLIQSDKRFLAYNFSVTPVDGVILFPLTEYQKQVNDTEFQHTILSIPRRQLDVFMNGRLLIEDIGYKVIFPYICIFNKDYLVQPANTTPQHIHIRFRGLCTPDLKWEKPEDTGFIDHGVLSNNNRFDIRDDRVLSITIDGKIRTRQDLIFSETHYGVSPINHKNGWPYMIRDILVPLKGIIDRDTYAFRDQARSIDKSISDYMSVLHPEPYRNAPSAIIDRHQLMSPFICKILSLIISGLIPKSSYSFNITDQQVLDICKPYENLLQYDPVYETNKIDKKYVVIHPSNENSVLTIDLYAYRFLLKVIKLYCNGLVDVSEFVTIEGSVA